MKTVAEGVQSIKYLHGVKTNKGTNISKEHIGLAIATDVLKMSIKNDSEVEQREILREHKEILYQSFGRHVWWNDKCEELSLKYLLWQNDLISLRR
jgi:hypothetical protein